MPRHCEKRVIPHSAEQLFDLVADVARYPEFLPWCYDAKVYDKTQASLNADLLVGYKALRDTFSSHVTLGRPHSIKVEYTGGPLSHLSNAWQFDPAPEGSCLITFTVDFAFRSPLLTALMNAFFDRAFLRMVEAFEERATALYGAKL